MRTKLFTFLLLAVTLPALLLVSSCTKEEPTKLKAAYTDPVKLAPLLYKMDYSQYYPQYVLEFFDNMNSLSAGAACSAVRNGNFVGRNLDFFYDKTAEIVVLIPPADGHYASINVCSCNPNITAKELDKGHYTPYFESIPYFAVDGINEKGLYASINMVPTGDAGYTTGTKPGAPTLYPTMVIRYVLDNCSTAKEACEELSKMNIKTAHAMGEFHYFIADPNETYVVEIIDNKFCFSNTVGNIMTNFYMLHNGLTPNACGIERFDVLAENYDKGATKEGMCELMQMVKYSKKYDRSTNPFWYSEYYGMQWKGKTIDINTPVGSYEELIDAEILKYKADIQSFLSGIWITVHTSVYDLENKTLRVYSQEDYSKFWEFKMEDMK